MRLGLKTVLIAALFVLSSTSPAFAGEEDKSGIIDTDILGTWSFQTKPYRQGACLMTGTMYLSPHEEEGLYNCELTAVEMCSMWGRSVVRQSCEARRFGNQVSIRSKVEEMLESKAEGLTYVPDNFTLTVQSSKRMFGALVSAVTAPAEFLRSNDGIS
ncbi:MAG: hypothetical protein ACRBEQ_00270 [Hyphomonas sp.]